MTTERIVFAYSGSDDSSAVIPLLADEYGAEIVTLTLDVGQDHELGDVRDRALEAGAVRAHVLDARDEFAHEFVLPVLQAGALREGHEPIGFPLAHSLIGKKLAEIARIEEATAVAHHGSGPDQVRIENSVRSQNSKLSVIAFGGGAPCGGKTRTNLWGRAVDYRDTGARPESLYSWTTSSEAAPSAGAHVEIAFEQGVPTAVNGVPLGLTELIESVSIIAGQHGVGRIPAIQDEARSDESRRIHEAPAATVLHAAHDALEMKFGAADLTRLKRQSRGKYAELVVDGLWFTQAREALDAFNALVQEQVSGMVRIQLLKGQYTVVGIRDPGSGIRGSSSDLAISDPGSRIPDPDVLVRRP
ncbi:MAG TPA: argininosuccinate synthase domain-containing protein [Vicinamibacterales bacterium]